MEKELSLLYLLIGITRKFWLICRFRLTEIRDGFKRGFGGTFLQGAPWTRVLNIAMREIPPGGSSQSSSPSPFHSIDSIPPSRTPSPTRTSSPSQSFSPSSSTSHSSTVSESPSPSSNPSPTVSGSVSTTPGPSLILEPFPSSPSPPLFAPSPTQSRALEPTQSQALKPTCAAQCTSGAPFESVVFSTSDSASLSASDNDGTITAQVTAPAGVVDYYSTLELSVHTINAFVTEITLVNQFGQQITELNEPIQICLAPTHNRSPDEICLGFLNEESGEWECEDCSVNHESGSDLLCGESGKCVQLWDYSNIICRSFDQLCPVTILRRSIRQV